MNEFVPVDLLLLDDRIRGVPPGEGPFPAAEVGKRNWRPTDGSMALPVLTLDEAAFLHNRDLMLAYVRSAGIEIAPHAKTPMAPDLARLILDAGAWGATVADIRQAAVMLKGRVTRLIVANEVGGAGGARRLASLMFARPANAHRSPRCACSSRSARAAPARARSMTRLAWSRPSPPQRPP
jgi:D-serine dehydratase